MQAWLTERCPFVWLDGHFDFRWGFPNRRVGVHICRSTSDTGSCLYLRLENSSWRVFHAGAPSDLAKRCLTGPWNYIPNIPNRSSLGGVRQRIIGNVYLFTSCTCLNWSTFSSERLGKWLFGRHLMRSRSSSVELGFGDWTLSIVLHSPRMFPLKYTTSLMTPSALPVTRICLENIQAPHQDFRNWQKQGVHKLAYGEDWKKSTSRQVIDITGSAQ